MKFKFVRKVIPETSVIDVPENAFCLTLLHSTNGYSYAVWLEPITEETPA